MFKKVLPYDISNVKESIKKRLNNGIVAFKNFVKTTENKFVNVANKVMPYNIKKVYLMILLAMGLGATMTSCDDKNDDPQPKHHNSTIVWGANDPLPEDYNILAHTDSTLVDTLFFESDGLTWEGTGSTLIINYLEPKMNLSSKIRGKGNLNRIGVRSEADSLQLVNWGFTVNQKTK